jgi:hypothetical protein
MHHTVLFYSQNCRFLYEKPVRESIDIKPSCYYTGFRCIFNCMKKRTMIDNYWQAMALRELAFKLKVAQVKKVFPELSEKEVHEKVKKIFLYAST